MICITDWPNPPLNLTEDAVQRELALDEAILESSIASIRFWELEKPAVILGRSSRIADETDQAFCRKLNIGIFRRCSGGASVVAGPGCRMYSVVLPLSTYPELSRIDAAHDFVMNRMLDGISSIHPEVQRQGICDLTINERKFGGNALRVTRNAVLYHGTLLYDFDIDLLSRCLRFAPRQPEYRKERSHREFVTNLPIQKMDQVCEGIARSFGAHSSLTKSPSDFQSLVDQFRQSRYDDLAWHHRH